MDNSGSLNAQVIHQITNRVRSKVAFQVEYFSLHQTFFSFMHGIKVSADSYTFLKLNVLFSTAKLACQYMCDYIHHTAKKCKMVM